MLPCQKASTKLVPGSKALNISLLEVRKLVKQPHDDQHDNTSDEHM